MSDIVIDVADGNDQVFGSNPQTVLSDVVDGKIYIKKLDDVPVTTITGIAPLNVCIRDSEAIYYLLPVWTSDHKSLVPGNISSIRLNGKCRGAKGGFFKNSATIDIYTGEKQLSTKLSSKKIQMCGAKSLDMATRGAEYLVNHINECVDFISYIHQNKSLYVEAGNWLLDNCKGQSVQVENCVVQGRINMVNLVSDWLISYPDESVVPEEYKYIVSKIIYRLSDINYRCELVPILEYYSSLAPTDILGNVRVNMSYLEDQSLAEDPILPVGTPVSTLKVGRSMVNYNYKLGFKIDRYKLANILKSKGMGVQLVNTVNSYIRVEMSSSIENDEYVIRRKGSHSKQLFLIYMSGSVMHSGPGGDCMANCYYNFMIEIAQVRDLVIIED